jgi:curved DNA-binding protein CbpA
LANFYDILQVKTNATNKEIKLAYKKLAFIHHPDKNQGDKKAEERFKTIVEAYKTLSSPPLRTRYNQKIGLHVAAHDINYRYHEGGLYRSILNHQPNNSQHTAPKPEVFQSKRKDLDFYLFWSCLGMTLVLAAMLLFFSR